MWTLREGKHASIINRLEGMAEGRPAGRQARRYASLVNLREVSLGFSRESVNI